MLLKVRRPFLLGGKHVKAGEVIDLAPLNLPPGRAQRLVDSRLGEYVTETLKARRNSGATIKEE